MCITIVKFLVNWQIKDSLFHLKEILMASFRNDFEQDLNWKCVQIERILIEPIWSKLYKIHILLKKYFLDICSKSSFTDVGQYL